MQTDYFYSDFFYFSHVYVCVGGWVGDGEIDKGGPKVQASSFKINKSQGCNV